MQIMTPVVALADRRGFNGWMMAMYLQIRGQWVLKRLIHMIGSSIPTRNPRKRTLRTKARISHIGF